MSVRAGVDVGGSGVRAIVELATGRRRVRLTGPTHRRATIDGATVVEAAVDAVTRAADVAHPPQLDAVCVGTTGLPGLLDDPAAIAAELRERLGARQVMVASDALTTHLGALGGRPGVVVAAGTGVIALGTDLGRVWNRTDGWGHLLGDEGGGAWIGRRGLVAALRHLDGRAGGSAPLADAVHARYGDPPGLLGRVYNGESPSFELASFAPAVADAARGGDAVASSIWRRAGERLAESAVAAATGLEPRFSWGGGLFRTGSLLEDPFRRAVLARIPGARIVGPDGDGADGALRLLDHPQVTRHAGAFLHASGFGDA